MISIEQFSKIICNPEEDYIDFKAKPHDLGTDYQKSEFIKDILAMANLPKHGSKFIVLGIKLEKNGNRELLGVTDHPDDSDLHNFMNKARVAPLPGFLYTPIQFEGKSFGVIEIFEAENGPFMPNKDIGVIKAQKIYTRRGTQNVEADVDELKSIFQFYSDKPKMVIPAERTYSQLNWGAFYNTCHLFEKERNYLFVIGPDNTTPPQYWSLFANLPLNIVIDFDPKTNSEKGIYNQVIVSLKEKTSVHLMTRNENKSIHPENACYWYAAKGLDNMDSNEIDWRSWNRIFSPSLNEFLATLYKSQDNKPLTVIFLWNAPEYIRELCSTIDRIFFEKVDYVYAFENVELISAIQKQFSGTAIEIRAEDLLFSVQKNIQITYGEKIIGLPDNEGVFKPISNEDFNWLSEDMEILHSNIDQEQSNEETPGLNFLRGHTINWTDLDLHTDAERDCTAKLESLLVNDLETRTPTRLNLFHYPGAGGTTIARRIAWDLRRRYPTVLLKKIIPNQTIDKFRFIAKLTSQPILVIIEGSDIVADAAEQLYNEIGAAQIPIVLLSILRRYVNSNPRDRSVYVQQQLNDREVYRFLQNIIKFIPEKKTRILNIANSLSADFRTPFYLGLNCFEEQFEGLDKYIKVRLDEASSVHKEILTYIALAHYYGHRSISAQLFTKILGLPENKVVNLSNYLPSYLMELLVCEDDNYWRPAHQLISGEIIKQNLQIGQDSRIWTYNLCDWAIKFINLGYREYQIPTDEIVDLNRRVFILRDEHELLGTEFSGSSQYSKVIEDVPTNEAKLLVFKELVKAFPNEAHFWGHLGRFYSVTLREYDKAIDSINHAIEINSNDPVLFHMKGMCYRNKISSLISGKQNINESSIDLESIKELVEKAKEAFAQSRKLDPSSEHAYISIIQLLIKVLDFGFANSGRTTRADFLSDMSSQWFREQLDEAESLLEEVKVLREGERESTYFLECQSQLGLLYDNYSLALQNWQNLLSRKDVFAPPIRRQIIRVYIQRNNREWSNLDPKTIERILELSEQNLLEEPNSAVNIRLWFQAIRFSLNYDIDYALEKVSRWMTFCQTIDAYYYLYILHAIKAMQGSTIEAELAKNLIVESQQRSKNLRNRTRSFEWYGKGNDLSRLINVSRLGEWLQNIDFYEKSMLLDRVSGIVSEVKGPESGLLKLEPSGLSAFFVPGKANIYRGKDENARVNFFIGFSYDGLRAWRVQKEESK